MLRYFNKRPFNELYLLGTVTVEMCELKYELIVFEEFAYVFFACAEHYYYTYSTPEWRHCSG